MEYVCVDALFPTWKMWTTFATQESLSALRRDYLPGVQAIKTEVNHPDEISTLFDPSIVYAKGARVLVMLRAYVGEEAFRTGLSQYFKAHAYKNTVGDDLWASLSEASGEDINAFMKPWLEQSGMPVISVARQANVLELSQKKFVIPAAQDNTVWPIPLNGVSEKLPKLLAVPRDEVEFASDEPFALINHMATTHAIVSYDEQTRQQLERALAENKLDEVDRLSLLHDMSLLARSGEQSATGLLALIKQYSAETSEPVWSIISLAISDVRRLVEEDEEAEKALKNFVGQLALPTYERLGWDEIAGEDERDTKLRATAIGLLGYSENKEIITKSLAEFRAVTSAQDLPGELRATILVLAVKHGNSDDIERLIKEYKTTSSSELQNDIASGLTATKDITLINRLVDFLKDETIVRKQDLFRWFAWLIRNRHGREATWHWLVENWGWIETTFAGDKSYDDFARYSASAFGTRAWLEQYKAFFADKRSIPALTRAIDLGIADIVVRAEWYDRDAAAVSQKLKSEAAN
jgi:aminopeptidase N